MQDISSEQSAAQGSGAPAGFRILVLDDEVAIADLVKEIFEAEGMAVTACYDPSSALQMVQKSPFDLAIVDIMMPRMDGITMMIK